MNPRSVVILYIAVHLFPGCGRPESSIRYQTIDRESRRTMELARQRNEDGLLLVEADDLAEAEVQFRRALEHDLYYAAAHNNLGLVLLLTERHYEAALEFDFATRLAPTALEPRQNLALLYEAVGRMDRAIDTYEAALEIEPDNYLTMRHLARAFIKDRRDDENVKALLERARRGPIDARWDSWLRGQLIRIDGRRDAD